MDVSAGQTQGAKLLRLVEGGKYSDRKLHGHTNKC